MNHVSTPVRRLGREALVRPAPWHGPDTPHWQPLLDREWLITNGLGGYASGTVSGAATRRYHGYLIASLPAPLGRILTLARVAEVVRLPDGAEVRLEGQERAESVSFGGTEHLVEFRLEAGLPVWRFEVGDAVIEKRVLMPYEQNTAHLLYRLRSGPPVRLGVRPYVHFRRHGDPVDTPLPGPFTITAREDRLELSAAGELPALGLRAVGRDAEFRLRQAVLKELLYRVEAHRGYAARGDLWRPGTFVVELSEEEPASLLATVEPWEIATAVGAEEALRAELERRDGLRELVEVGCRPAPPRDRSPGLATEPGTGSAPAGGQEPGVGRGSPDHAAPAEDPDLAQLALTADQFLVLPAWRRAERTGPRGAEAPLSVVAGYHWFTDWGRDTMISLEGLLLCTGRFEEARRVLRSFVHHLRGGLIPNLFPEEEGTGLYHTVDATLWLFHAVERYVACTGDRATLHTLLPALEEAVRCHVAGTDFAIGVDPADGLLRQGAEGYQLTWMDAKVDDWVVTPRRGKAVEINALWYNALRLLEGWLEEEGAPERAAAVARHAERAARAFDDRFWYAAGGHLYDVVDGEDGDDPACRPNQLLALSLRHPVLRRELWAPVLEVVRDRLLTPFGLRTLAPGHPEYRAEYFGDLRARDAAYHQGTVWPWLIGPFVDAWLRVHPGDVERARAFLSGLIAHLDDACVGSVSEIFDAEPPHTPRGCVAQAWSVAELLRCLRKTASRPAAAAPAAPA